MLTVLLASALPAAGQSQRAPESEARPSNVGSKQVAAGRQVFNANCSFCHGAAARGGAQGGPDLTQSKLVRGDAGGEQLGAFLQVGRPARGMPAFHLSEENVLAIAAFLHGAIQASDRHPVLGQEVLVGNAVAGKVFFYGAGHCTKCHSETGDLSGIGSRYPPAVLQGRIVLPIGHGGYPGLSPPDRSTTQVTVKETSGKTLAGTLVFLSDYAVTVMDSAGERHTLARHGDNPKILLQDQLQAHLDLLLLVTDQQMHNLTAYLATLK